MREHALDRPLLRRVHQERDRAAGALRPRLDEVVVDVVHGDLVLALDLSKLLPCVRSDARAHKEDPLLDAQRPAERRDVPLARARLRQPVGPRRERCVTDGDRLARLGIPPVGDGFGTGRRVLLSGLHLGRSQLRCTTSVCASATWCKAPPTSGAPIAREVSLAERGRD